MNCEALLVLGSDFPYQQFYPRDAKIIQVDMRGEQIGVEHEWMWALWAP